LPPVTGADQRAFVQKGIESGRFARKEEAIEEALALWERRERRRLEIIAIFEAAEASLLRPRESPHHIWKNASPRGWR
jgi:Arc/MetJ-type ribon-helix-helix transcriptional regulator